MYRSETFLTHFGLVERLNEGIKPDQIVSITNASKESRGWVLIYKDDGKDYEKEPCNDAFMNKTCVSSRVCEHDKMQVLDKIRAEIVARDSTVKAIRGDNRCFFTAGEVLKIIDKYKAEMESKE